MSNDINIFISGPTAAAQPGAQALDFEGLMQLDALLEAFGPEQTGGAISNTCMKAFGEKLKAWINEQPGSQAMKDLAMEIIDSHINKNKHEVSSDCQSAVNESPVGKEAESLGTNHAESCCAAAEDNGDTSGGSGAAGNGESSTDMMISGTNIIGEKRTKKGGGKGGGESWLMQIAQFLGESAGKKLENALSEINKMDAEADKSKEFVVAQTRFQAQMQEFSFTSQSISTFIKSIGEAMGALARKQ